METTTQSPAHNQTDLTRSLKTVLADSYALLIKTHNFHWNVQGPEFFALHEAFQQQYTELFAAVDEIAERIRALGDLAPGGLRAFDALSSIQDSPAHLNARDMVKQLAADHRTLAAAAKAALDLADQSGDDATVDLMTARIALHDKTAWMLDSQAR